MPNKSTDMYISPELSEKLKRARKQKGLTQGQLAKKSIWRTGDEIKR